MPAASDQAPSSTARVAHPQRRLALAVLIAAALLTLIVALQARQRMIQKQRTHSTADINDFERWMRMVPKFIYHHASYIDDSFPTPPVTLMVFAPLTRLSVPNAQFVWVVCKLAFCLIIFFTLRHAVERTGVPLKPLAWLLILAVWLWPVLGDMQEGQTNLLMLTPLALGLTLAQVDHRPAQWLAGLLIALAICIKVTPVIFLLYFLWKRRGGIVTGIVAGMGIWLLAVPALAFGWRQNLRWLEQWTQIMILPYVMQGRVQYFVGQSVPSFLSRLLRHVPAFYYHVQGGKQAQYVNLLRLPAPVSDWIIRTILTAVGVSGLWWARRRLPTLRRRRYWLETGAVAIFELWASPRTWVPHYVTLVIPLFAVAMVLSDPRQTLRMRTWAIGALGAAAMLMFLTTDVGKVFGPYGHDWLLTFGVSLWASVLLVAVIFAAAITRHKPIGAGPGVAGAQPHPSQTAPVRKRVD